MPSGKRNAGQGFGTKPPSARHFSDSMPLFEIHIRLHISADGNMDFTLCDCSCRIGRFRCTDTAVRSTDGGKVCGANTLGTAEEDLTRNGAAARPCHRRGSGLS